MISQQVSQYIPKIRDFFQNQPIIRAWLFGSCSRGEETESSDVDILVEYDKNRRISLLSVCGMMIDLEAILGRKVDMVENGRLRDFAVPSVEKDKLLIYERAAQR